MNESHAETPQSTQDMQDRHDQQDQPDSDQFDLDDTQDIEEVAAFDAEDSWSYEVPRPWLSIHDAAMMLGRSVRGVERSIIGRWGNRLPEGWQARRVRIDGVDEWRIIPPPGFRVKHSKKLDPSTRAALEQAFNSSYGQNADESEYQDLDSVPERPGPERSATASKTTAETSDYHYRDSSEDKDVATKTEEGQSGFSLEKLFQSASQMAQKELASIGLNVKNQLMVDSQNHAAGLDVEHTIVIDRSDEVEKLLRELANVQKELSEERRLHMEDMRLMSQMQNNMRLLEVNATQTSELREDLQMAQKLLSEHKKQYQAYLALPWWKKIFKSQP